MLHWKSKLAVFGVMSLCAASQCQFDDDPVSSPNGSGGAGGTGGVSAAGGAVSAGGRGYIVGTGGVSPWIDAGLLCVENLPSNVTQVQTYKAADIENCALILEDSTNFQTLYHVYVYVDCHPLSEDSDDGGHNWFYDYVAHAFTFRAEICDTLASLPNQRVDVTFETIVLD